MALTASPDDQAHLLELQAIDTKLNQLDHRAKALPENALVTSLGKAADVLRGERLAASGLVDDAKIELSRIESDVAVVEARIARDTERVQSSSSVKDVAGLESELLGLRKRQSDLEEIELTVMERLETLEAALGAIDDSLAAIESQVSDATAERDAALGTLAIERRQAAADRATIASGLPADLIALYERQRDRYGFGASFLQGGVSKASGVKLNENDMQLIRAAAPNEVLLCPDSSAILVRTKDSGL
jgi:predicted  nucleic acid-binding Zn-ribbon protein